MKQLLAQYVGKVIEIHCGGSAAVRGTLVDIIDGVARLKAEEDEIFFYVAIDKIQMFAEVKEKEKALGFVGLASPRRNS